MFRASFLRQFGRLQSSGFVRQARTLSSTAGARFSKHKHLAFGLSGAAVLIVSHRMGRQNLLESKAKEESKAEGVFAAHDKENFFRFMRFGMVDMSLLLVSLVAGVSFDGVIARFIGVQGYGAIVGAGLGNCFADVVAGMPEGVAAALGVGCGTLLPLLPITIPMLMKLPLSRPVSLAFGTAALGFCIFAFAWGYEHNHASSAETEALVSEVESLIRDNKIDSAIAVLQEQASKKH